MTNAISNVIVVSDMHCGCRLGLCPPSGITLDDGGEYRSSKVQRKLWEMWREFWDEWVPEVTHNEPYCVVVNGDCVDGVHHGSTTQISQNLKDQADIVYNVMKPIADACHALYWIRGTPAHTGQSSIEEERCARRLKAVPNKEGQHARYELWKKIGGDHLVHFMHHIGTTSSAAHEASAVNAELTAEIVEAGRWHERVPDVVVRSNLKR